VPDAAVLALTAVIASLAALAVAAWPRTDTPTAAAAPTPASHRRAPYAIVMLRFGARACTPAGFRFQPS